MNVNIETPSTLRRKITIELEPEEIQRELDRAYNQLRRTVLLKGFRPGRAPRNLLERFFGDQVRGDVMQKLQREYTVKALEENSLTPLLDPEVVTEESDLKKPQVRFSAIFDLKPEIVVKDYQDLKVPKAEIKVTDEDVDQTLQRLRERNGTLNRIERETIQPNDFVMASFEAFEEDKPLPNSKFEERVLRVAPESVAHGLEEVLAGASVGTEIRKTRSYPADYFENELAGKTVEWRAKVSDIYERVLPQVDDEFAKDQGGYENLEELRAALRRELERRAAVEADHRARQALIDLIVERNPIEVPESLVTREQRNLELEAASALEAAGMSREAALNTALQAGDTGAKAERRARGSLIVDAIAEQEKVEVTDDEVAERVAETVSQATGRQRERLADFYSHPENRAGLQRVMRREKTLDLLLSRAQSGGEGSAEPGSGESGSGEASAES
jgi:trigger factor